MCARKARLCRMITYKQESVVEVCFELTGEVRGFPFSSWPFELAGCGSVSGPAARPKRTRPASGECGGLHRHTVGPSARSDKKISGLIQRAVWSPRAGCSNRPPARPQRVRTRGVLFVYVEGVRDARTTLAACFNILRLSHMGWDLQPRPSQTPPAGSHNYRIAHKPGLPPDRNNYESDETGHAVRSLAG